MRVVLNLNVSNFDIDDDALLEYIRMGILTEARASHLAAVAKIQAGSEEFGLSDDDKLMIAHHRTWAAALTGARVEFDDDV